MTISQLVFSVSVVPSLIVLGVAARTAAQTETLPTQMAKVEGRAMRVAVAGLGERKPGQPIVILEAGAGAGLEAWRPVFGEIARLAPVLAYDRRGLGQSEVDTQPQTIRRVAQSLHDLLTTMRIAPPYVLVGHSFGAIYIRGFSDSFPNEVAGYVYVEAFGFESTREEKAAALPEAERAQALAPPVLPTIPPDTPPGLRAEIDLIAREMLSDGAEARTLRPKQGVPVAVIIAAPPGRLKHPGDVMMRLAIKTKSEWVLQSSNGLFIVSGRVGHNVMKDDPALVLQAVKHALQAAPDSK